MKAKVIRVDVTEIVGLGEFWAQVRVGDTVVLEKTFTTTVDRSEYRPVYPPNWAADADDARDRMTSEFGRGLRLLFATLPEGWEQEEDSE